MKRRLLIILLSFISFICLTGCWDSAELQDLSIILGIGIDKGGDNEENRYRATVQIVDPSQVAGGQQGGKVQSSPVTSYSATGATISEALRKISFRTPSHLFFPHIQIMLIGEDLAKDGINEVFDLIDRNSQFRLLFPLLVVKNNTAEEALKIMTALDPIPSSKILRSLESSSKAWGVSPAIRVDQVIEKINDGSLIISGVQINGDEKKGNETKNIQKISQDTSLEIGGLALFKNSKLEKWLDRNASRGTSWINNEMESTIITLDCKEKKDAIAIEIARSNLEININIKNQKPVINITNRTEGSVYETECSIDLNNSNVFEQLEAQLEEEIKEEIVAAVEVTKKEKSDIFEFGKYINIKDKKLWKKIEKKWEEEIFPETEIIVDVDAAIRRTGMRTKSYIE